MILEKIRIENFKSFQNVTVNFNSDINIFTGVNNSGKTTVLEAVALWEECFRKLIKQAQKSDPKINIKKGDYKLGDKTHNYLDYREITSVRSPKFEDIFYNLNSGESVSIEAQLKEGTSIINIGFVIKGASGSNYDILLKDYDSFDYISFNRIFSSFPQPINLVYASPVSSVVYAEEFETIPKIKEKINSRNSITVIRNRLYNLSKDSAKFSDFMSDLQQIVFDGEKEIFFDFIGNEREDVSLMVNIKLGEQDIAKDLALLGSGTLQIIEILLSLYEKPKSLNLVLLDEPDSHIHRDTQKRLLKTLINHTQNTQIFLTTHNESLIRSSDERHLFYLEKEIRVKEYFPIYKEVRARQPMGLQPSKHINILKSLGSETALDFLNALEADKLILVEGDDDAEYLQMILDKKYIGRKQNVMYWSFKGVKNLLEKIKAYKELFGMIKNGKSLWEKSVLVFDGDYTTEEQKNKIKNKIKEKLKINTYIWKGYTFESFVTVEKEKFYDIVVKIARQKGITEDKDVIKEKCNQEIEKYIVLLRGRIENDENGKISNEILNNKKAYNKIDENFYKDIFDSEVRVYSEYRKYAVSLLENGHIYHLVNKEDIQILIKNIFISLGINEDEDYFSKVMENIDRGIWYQEFDELIRVIEA